MDQTGFQGAWPPSEAVGYCADNEGEDAEVNDVHDFADGLESRKGVWLIVWRE